VATQARLIDDLLDSRRLAKGEGGLAPGRIVIRDHVLEAIESVRPAAEERRQTLTASNTAQEMQGDADRLRQVLVNLLTNAVKFTPPSGRIEVRSERRGSRIVIEVVDNGIGLTPEWAQAAFEPFRRGEGVEGRHAGLGLGLTLARRLVELHGGRLDARSDGPGKGSTFLIELPAPLDGRVPVLVVEDDEETRNLIEQLLKEQGHEPAAFASASAAYAYLERLGGDEGPRLIVSDIGLPEEDGYSFIRRVHALHADRNELAPPSLALTGFTSEGARKRALDAGFEAHLCKPVDPRELQDTIERLLQPRQPQPVP
jgi:CheY-like chemotaxis protein/anti-sigma regulatory factor (Ser/Thr protein kinase)